ncbi:MAG: hypothetical protein NVSMB52_02080 [Chloroflexota bacterium]
MSSLLSELNLPARTCTALIGAGGKTSIAHALSNDYAARGRTSLLTTPTKIWPPPELPIILSESTHNVVEAIRGALNTADSVVYAHSLLPNGKLLGAAPDDVCALHCQRIADAIFVEADGAAGASLKAHGVGEPVIPECADTVLVIAGLDALGAIMTPSMVHRMQEMERITSRQAGETITADDIARSMEVAASFSPTRASTVYVVNKVDSDVDVVRAGTIASALLARHSRAVVVFVSHGCLVDSTTGGPDMSTAHSK